jgi:ubiquitin-protein ligase
MLINSYGNNKYYIRKNKELIQLKNKYNIIILNNENFYIKQFDIYIKIKNNYPFSRPIIKYMNMDYINYYLKKSNFYNFDIKIECITWVPTLRINNIIIDYIKYNKIFSNAYKYIIIYNNLNSLFDDLIYYSIKSFIL